MPGYIICVSDETDYGAVHAAHEYNLIVWKDAAAGFEGLRDSIHTESAFITLEVPAHDFTDHLVKVPLAILSV